MEAWRALRAAWHEVSKPSEQRSGLQGEAEKTPREAEYWYTLAAESGHREAQNALALMLEEGREGVPRDSVAALKWHLKAAEQGNAVSQFCCASLLSTEGEAQEAEGWLRKSAAQGFPPAQEVLEEISQGECMDVAQRVASQLESLEDPRCGLFKAFQGVKEDRMGALRCFELFLSAALCSTSS